MTKKLSDPEFRTKVAKNMDDIPDEIAGAMMNQAIREANELLKAGSIDVGELVKRLHRAFITGTATGMALKDNPNNSH